MKHFYHAPLKTQWLSTWFCLPVRSQVASTFPLTSCQFSIAVGIEGGHTLEVAMRESRGVVMQKKPLIWSLLVLCFALPSRAQNQTPLPQILIIDNNATPPDKETRERMAHDQAKKAAEERQAVLKTDADKLLKLAEELKRSVDQSNKSELSLEAIKKAQEIEKLAHSLKHTMKSPN
jgi:hypothetical protein